MDNVFEIALSSVHLPSNWCLQLDEQFIVVIKPPPVLILCLVVAGNMIAFRSNFAKAPKAQGTQRPRAFI